jgi:DNA-binding MarR family transcriptional regulator
MSNTGKRGAARGAGFDISPERSFGYLLRDTSRLLQRMLQERVTRHGVTLSQNFILRELWETDGLTIRELGVRLRVVDPRMTTTIDALERKGLVKRVGSTSDRRRVHVFLTPKGRALHDDCERYSIEVNASALNGVSPAALREFRAVLGRVKTNLESRDDS